jgi:hypothetical protein
MSLFQRLGSAIKLTEPIMLLRGIAIPPVPNEYDPDIAGLGEHLSQGAAWHHAFTDAGFRFAATDAVAARRFDGTGNGGWSESMRPTLFELTVHSGLCIPEHAHRGPALFKHLVDTRFLDTGISQVVFPPDTQWEIDEVHEDSTYGLPLVRMRQL